TADGKWIDYCKAYEQMCYPPEMKTDDNGYRIIARHLGLPEYELTYFDPKSKERKSYDLDKDALRAQGYEKLGLPPDNKPDMKLMNRGIFLMEYAKTIHPNDNDAAGKLEGELYSRVMEQPWTLEDYSMMAPLLEQTSPVLDIVSEAVSKPAFRQPLVVPEGHESLQHLIELSLPPIQEFRNYAREFQARFHYRLGQGDIDGAIADKIATHRLGRHVQNQGLLVSYLVGIAIDGIAYSGGIADNLESQPTAEQIRRLIQLQSELSLGMTAHQAHESERFLVLDTFQNYARGIPSPSEDAMPPMVFRFVINMPYNWNVVMSRANQYISGELEPPAQKPSTGNVAGSVFRSIFSRNKRSEVFIDILASLWFPAVDAAEKAKHRLDCIGNMQRITLAMLLYYAEHGTLPPAFSVDADDKPLHSWRVLLLPWLGDAELAELYGQIRLDEPWDSESNRQFHERVPDVYRCPTCETRMQPGDTSYCVILGEETPFDGSGTGKTLSGFGTESGGMALIAETRTPGNWMNPGFDVTFDEAKTGINGNPPPHIRRPESSENVIGSYHTGGANVGLRNGAVTFLSEKLDPEVWERVLTGKERVR
ncbi:MAG: DUF1559 domain-containing protein, partial [Planctomycetaceae bacterium]|nr:DUF1559 domain-containing protein [Planctomycetaceae bacterium]